MNKQEILDSLLVHDHDVTIISAATGEILRQLAIDPIRDYQPTGRPRVSPPQSISLNPQPQVQAIPMS